MLGLIDIVEGNWVMFVGEQGVCNFLLVMICCSFNTAKYLLIEYKELEVVYL